MTRLAWNPNTRKPDLKVLIPEERVFKGRPNADTYTAVYILTEALRNPDAVFTGLQRDSDEPRNDNSTGWLCYAYHPTMRYDDQGKQYPASENCIFLAFVNDEHVAYFWTWDYADKYALSRGEYLPKDYETRFGNRIY